MERVKKFLQAVLAVIMLGAGVPKSNAVIIEGYTPGGAFKAVGLDSQGNFRVAISSTGAIQHVVVDSGTISATQLGVWTVGQQGSWTVQQGGAPWAVTVSSAISVTTSVSLITDKVTGQVSLAGGSAVEIYPAETVQRQGVICNLSDSLSVWMGGAGVTQANGKLLPPGSCYSPDVPASFTGNLYGYSTAALTTDYIYHK